MDEKTKLCVNVKIILEKIEKILYF